MNTVELARARAAISAFLSNHPGRHLAADIAKELKATSGLDLSAKSVGTITAAMAKQKLLPAPLKKDNRKLWAWKVEEPAAPTPEETQPPPKRRGGKPMADLSEVEIALGRTTLIIQRDQFDTVIVGLNEITGRIRITINP